jgi:exodeoxyribonuclease V alpha subunit
VLKVKAKGRRDLVTVVGSLASVSAGAWVTAEGRWVQDREFGLQFRAELLNSIAPTTREASRNTWAAWCQWLKSRCLAACC